ncbi:MAG: oligoribonuclease [Candidatus Pacebacteria bacterium]|nr:oligoribonuclease [Candidatus Paceibacterota bacterium]
MQRNDLLVWMDLEMTSIQDVLIDRITEIAVIITDKDLAVVAELPSIIIHTDQELYESRKRPEMREVLSQSSLMKDATTSTITMEEAEKRVLAFLEEYVAPQSAPLCGNSIHMDRHFLRMQMPTLEKYLFYRCVDVSTVKELARRWAPEVYEEGKRRKGEGTHRAMDDIRASIEELKFYRETFFKP